MVLDGSDGSQGATGEDGLSVFITYNDNISSSTPSTPTGDGTSDGWHTTPTYQTNWMSQKVASDASSGTWGSPILIAGGRKFTSTPTTPYSVGDLWLGGSSGDLKICITARASGAYVATDWELATKYTDDTTANTKIKTYYQDDAPTTGLVDGDFWVDTNDDNQLYRWDSSIPNWVSIRDDLVVWSKSELESMADDSKITQSERINIKSKVKEITGPSPIIIFYSAEDGTTTTNIEITNHGLITGDYIINRTRDYIIQSITKVDNNNFTVTAIPGQTQNDEIVFVNDYIDNLILGKAYQILQQAIYVGILSTDMVYINYIINLVVLIAYMTDMPTTTGGTLDAWDVSTNDIIDIVAGDWNSYWSNYNSKYDSLNQAITEYTSKTGSTFIVGTYENAKRADYVVPYGSTSAQTVINQAIDDLPEVIIETGVAVSATTNTIVLPSTSSSTHNKYIGYTIEITSGTGVGQIRSITSYNGDTKTINISSSSTWTTTPDNTSNYKIYSKSGKIVLLEGIYTIDNSIYLLTNVSLQGQGSNTVIKIKDGASNCNDPDSFYMIYNDDSYFVLQNVEISSLTLDGNKNNNSGVNSYGTYLSLYNSKINNITVTSCLKDGISLTYAIMCDVNNNSINNCDEDGIDIAAGTVNDNYCTVFNNLIDYCNNGIECSGSTHVKVLNNTINYPQINGISLSNGAENIYVNLNRINYSGSHGIYMNYTKFCTIDNNTVLNAGIIIDNTYSGIFITTNFTSDYARSNTITNNTCIMDSSSTNKPAYGIKFADSHCVYNTVTNNILYQSGSSDDLIDNGSYNEKGNGNRLNDGSWGV